MPHLSGRMFTYFCSSTVNKFSFYLVRMFLCAACTLLLCSQHTPERSRLCCHEDPGLDQIQTALHPEPRWVFSELTCCSPTCHGTRLYHLRCGISHVSYLYIPGNRYIYIWLVVTGRDELSVLVKFCIIYSCNSCIICCNIYEILSSRRIVQQDFVTQYVTQSELTLVTTRIKTVNLLNPGEVFFVAGTKSPTSTLN